MLFYPPNKVLVIQGSQIMLEKLVEIFFILINDRNRQVQYKKKMPLGNGYSSTY